MRPDDDEVNNGGASGAAGIVMPIYKRLARLAYVVALLAIFGAMVIPGLYLTKLVIEEDPISISDIWYRYRFQFFVVCCYILAAHWAKKFNSKFTFLPRFRVIWTLPFIPRAKWKSLNNVTKGGGR